MVVYANRRYRSKMTLLVDAGRSFDEESDVRNDDTMMDCEWATQISNILAFKDCTNHCSGCEAAP